MQIIYISILLSGVSVAFQLPFKLPFLKSGELTVESVPVESIPDVPRIAIIGAGAGGSSAAFWISKAQERFGLDVEVDVYDRESYIGGRSTTVYPHDDKSLDPIELGASIFVQVNKNLWRASDEFNLSRTSFEEDSASMGIWDGEKFLLTTGGGYFGEWWSTLKILWRYGFFAPTQTQKIVKAMTDQFLQLYALNTPKWTHISDLASSFGWTDMVTMTTSDFLENRGVSTNFIQEMVEGATRVNYGQNVDDIHALEGVCSMAATGATSIRGGNWKIFEQFLHRSKASVLLNNTVHRVKRKSTLKEYLTVSSDRGSTTYKAVIIAAPFHSTGIHFPKEVSAQVPEQPYVHLHVTLLSTTASKPNPAYFSLSPSADIPSMVLTTYKGVRQGGKEPEFNSLSYHGLISETEWSVKIFSKERVSDEWLSEVFSGQVGWVYRKEWDAYPKLPPTITFPPVKLADGIYYVNAFEPFISTMETETIASRNVVDLMLHEVFNSSICGASKESHDTQIPLTETPVDFVYGWDC